MARFSLLVASLLALISPELGAGQGKGSHSYQFSRIQRIETTYFGAQQIYFDCACNEQFVELLTKRVGPSSLQLGILTQLHPSNCSKPPREISIRTRLGNNSWETVMTFDEVWRCQGTCYIISDPEMSPYRPVEEYGTSEKQTREKIPCSPDYQIDMVCDAIEVGGG